MNTDALTAIEHFANGIFSAGMDFLFTWGEFLGVIGLIAHLARSRVDGPTRMTPGKFVGGLFTCAMLVSLPSIINAGGIQMGFMPILSALSLTFNLSHLVPLPVRLTLYCHWQSWLALDS